MHKEILIVGAGHQGLAMAAHFALNKESVRIWNRTEAHIKRIIDSKTIKCEGVVKGTAHIEKASTSIREVLTDTIFVTAPSSAHRDIARILAPVLLPNTFVYLNPGRTFGAIDFWETLRRCGCRNFPIIVEAQSIVYTCRRLEEDLSHIYALKNDVEMAYIGKCSKEEVIARIPVCIRERYRMVSSVLETSLGNIGMILHCAPVLLNTGWIESKKHAFYYYYDGISPSVGNLLEKMDRERMQVANCAGVNTFSLIEWFHSTYNVKGSSIYECIQNNDYYKEIDAPKSLKHRYLEEDIPNGLVPIEYLAISMGVQVPTISLIINLAQEMLDINYREMGRRYSLQKLKKILDE